MHESILAQQRVIVLSVLKCDRISAAMKNGRLYINWLVVITLFLFITSLGVFLMYMQKNLVSDQCAYGQDMEENCVCSSDGVKVCDEELLVKDRSVSEFTSSGLTYSVNFLNLVSLNNPPKHSVEFTDILQSGNMLKVVVDLNSMCNSNNKVAPQIGFYKLDNERLILTVISNLTDSSFNLQCRSENIFLIENFDLNSKETFKLQFQDESGNIYQASTCIYQGYIRNDGDVYVSKDSQMLCRCNNGVNSCEKR
jgi:hypothetical protein